MDKQNASKVKIALSENEGVVEAYVDKTRIAHLEEDMNILRAECIDLKRENKRLCDEVTDFKKTISKMQQAHEAEVQDLKDQLGEAKAAEAAAKKAHAHAVGEKNNYADALDDDRTAFEAILDLAHIAQSVSQSLYKVSKRIEAETEGRI